MDNGQANAGLDRSRFLVSDTLERPGAVIILNADDWGRDRATTDLSLECIRVGAISSVSAMVFMADSERAADLARLHGIDTGLHLNLTLPYSTPQRLLRLLEHQERLSRFLRSNRLAPVLYHPGLARSFEYVVRVQLEEYERLFGVPPNRLDGHHHMHLCANVVKQRLLPEGVIVRRNLTFPPGEKGFLNRFYRRRQDRRLASRHVLTDFFFDLQPFEPRNRLAKILELAAHFDIEVETHPIRDEEFRFLVNGELIRYAEDISVSRGYILRFSKSGSKAVNVQMNRQALRRTK